MQQVTTQRQPKEANMIDPTNWMKMEIDTLTKGRFYIWDVTFNKITLLENAKEIWDTLVDMHEGTDSIKESKLDVLQSQLDKFKM